MPEPTRISLRQYFTPAAVGVVLEEPAEVQTPLYDKFFRANARQHPMPAIGIERLMQLAQARPLVLDGTPSIPIGRGRRTIEQVRLEPIRLSSFMSAEEINQMRLLPRQDDRQTLANEHIRVIRTDVNMTVEGLVAQAMRGKITWPIKVDAGAYDVFQIDFTAYTDASNGILEVLPDVNLLAADSKAKDWVLWAQKVGRAYQRRGLAKPREFLCGEAVWKSVVDVADRSTTNKSLKVEMSGAEGESWVTIGGYKFVQWDYTYSFPKIENGVIGDERLPEVEPNHILAVSAGVNLPFRYLSISDLDAGLQALPLFIKTITQQDPSGEKIIGHTVPLPIPVPRAILYQDMTEVEPG